MNILIALLADCVKWHFTNSISIVLYCIGIPFCHAIPCCHWHWFVGETVSMESMWSLALIMKSIVIATVDRESGSSMEALLHQPQFVDGISYLAQLGTGLSPKWTVEDLEVFAINCCWNNDILSDYLESLHFFASSSLCQYEIVWLLKVVSHTHTHTHAHTHMHTHIYLRLPCWLIHLFTRSFLRWFIHAFIDSFIYWLIDLLLPCSCCLCCCMRGSRLGSRLTQLMQLLLSRWKMTSTRKRRTTKNCLLALMMRMSVKLSGYVTGSWSTCWHANSPTWKVNSLTR